MLEEQAHEIANAITKLIEDVIDDRELKRAGFKDAGEEYVERSKREVADALRGLWA